MALLASFVSACLMLATSAGAVVPQNLDDQPERGPRHAERGPGDEDRRERPRFDGRREGSRQMAGHSQRRERFERLRERIREEGGPRAFARKHGMGHGNTHGKVRGHHEMGRGFEQGRRPMMRGDHGPGMGRGEFRGQGGRGPAMQGRMHDERSQGPRGPRQEMGERRGPNADRPERGLGRPETGRGRPEGGKARGDATDARDQRILEMVERLNDRLDRLERNAPRDEGRENGRRPSGPAQGPGRDGREERGEGRGPGPRPERGQNDSPRNRE